MASCSQVSSLVQAYIDGELGNAEKSILEQHLRECATCRDDLHEQNACSARIFESLATQRLQWGLRSRVLDHLPEMDPAINQGSHPTDPQLARRRQRAPFPRWAAAAAMLLITIATAFVYSRTSGKAPLEPPVGMVTFSENDGVLSKKAGASAFQDAPLKSLVTPGEEFETLGNSRLAISLVGRSILKANHNTSLTVRNNRQVHVTQGLTFFDIGKDKRHFYVNTPAGEILVFGTAFIVDVTHAATTVTVSEGYILVSNRFGNTGVSAGNQLVFRDNEPLARPYPVDIAPLFAWADAIVPDPDALALFNQTLELRSGNASIAAVPVWAVWNLDERRIEAVQVDWIPDGLSSGHCGYIVQVADNQGNLLHIDKLDAEVFNDQQQNTLTLPLPNGPITGIDGMHIKLVPDDRSGSVESEITRVSLVAEPL